MRFLFAILIGATLSTGPAAHAQVLDLSTIKCRDFLASGKDNIGIILAWMNAYYKAEDDPAIIDFGQMSKDGEKLGAYCAANPDLGLITASDSLFEK